MKPTTSSDNSWIPHLLDVKAVKGCPQDHQYHNWMRMLQKKTKKKRAFNRLLIYMSIYVNI